MMQSRSSGVFPDIPAKITRCWLGKVTIAVIIFSENIVMRVGTISVEIIRICSICAFFRYGCLMHATSAKVMTCIVARLESDSVCMQDSDDRPYSMACRVPDSDDRNNQQVCSPRLEYILM